MALTPVQSLKLTLLAEGLTVSPEARALLSGEDGTRPLSLADYASTSGISLELPDDVWVNAPLADSNPNFVLKPRFALDVADGMFGVTDGVSRFAVRPLPVPAYHARTNPSGEPYTAYAHTHTDRVRISPVAGCAMGCRFCDLHYKLQYRLKSVEGLLDAVREALSDPILPAAHVLVSGGAPRVEDCGWLRDVYVSVCAAFPGTPVDVMMLPLPGLLDLNELLCAGVNGLAVNIELFSDDAARRFMPRKAAMGRDEWLDFLERAVAVFGQGRVRSLLMVGLESPEDTLRGVAALAERGCEPVLSPFRPDPATPLANVPPPSPDFMADLFQRCRDVAYRFGARLGPRCIPCQHNTLAFPDGSDYYHRY